MAELVRTAAWTRHELGPLDGWPVALRIAVTTCLASRSPMQVWWGPQEVVLYNDACIPVIGSQHPGALGRHAPELFGERWSTIRMVAERVRAEATVLEVDGLRLAPLVGERGTVDGIVCSFTEADSDSDEDASVERAENEEFLSLIGHELRNPLSALSTTMQVFELREPSHEVELMQRALDHLTRLVDDLLDVSRLARGTLVIHRKPIELATLADRATELVAPLVKQRNAKVYVRVSRTGLVIDADGERLARVFAHILTNAIEHSDSGSPIVFEAVAGPERARISIVDRGAGIARTELDRAFEVFRSERASGGLGLGLAIARGLVELHGGTIELQSDGLGHGTQCVIDLPLAAGVEVAAGRIAMASSVRKRVMLVEDNDDTARALAGALEQLGYEVIVAHNGPIALNLAREKEPDVALLDIGLPVMDGWELARRLRERVGHLHFVAVTARDQDSDRRASAEAGFAEHLVKPIDLGQLQRLVESLPGRS